MDKNEWNNAPFCWFVLHTYQTWMKIAEILKITKNNKKTKTSKKYAKSRETIYCEFVCVLDKSIAATNSSICEMGLVER